MKCPNCKAEMEPMRQDADFGESVIVGEHVNIEVVQHTAVCPECFKPISTSKFALHQLVDMDAHQGSSHVLEVHPQALEPNDGGYTVMYSLNCSCGVTRARSGQAALE